MGQFDGIDRRQFPRINYPCLIVIRNDDDGDEKTNTVLTHTDNVGVGGVGISLKQPVKTFSVVDIELDLLDLGNHICCKGKVVWNVEKKPTEEGESKIYDVGVEYIDIKDEDQSRLKEVIERLTKNNS